MKYFVFLFVCLSFVILAGCLTDKLVVFEKNLLTEKEMQAVLGDYTMVDWDKSGSGKVNSGSLSLKKEDTRYHFSHFADMTNSNGERRKSTWSGYFLLSQVPDTTIMLFSSPEVKCGGDKDTLKNFFAIMKQKEGKLYVWYCLQGKPIAEGNIKSTKNGFNAEELKAFLTEYADAYVLANPATFVFDKKSKDSATL